MSLKKFGYFKSGISVKAHTGDFFAATLLTLTLEGMKCQFGSVDTKNKLELDPDAS